MCLHLAAGDGAGRQFLCAILAAKGDICPDGGGPRLEASSFSAGGCAKSTGKSWRFECVPKLYVDSYRTSKE